MTLQWLDLGCVLTFYGAFANPGACAKLASQGVKDHEARAALLLSPDPDISALQPGPASLRRPLADPVGIRSYGSPRGIGDRRQCLQKLLSGWLAAAVATPMAAI
jgi:hypothetical protein